MQKTNLDLSRHKLVHLLNCWIKAIYRTVVALLNWDLIAIINRMTQCAVVYS